jgi:hypothetical protein
MRAFALTLNAKEILIKGLAGRKSALIVWISVVFTFTHHQRPAFMAV